MFINYVKPAFRSGRFLGISKPTPRLGVLLLALLPALLLTTCGLPSPGKTNPEKSAVQPVEVGPALPAGKNAADQPGFANYWYRGLAEINVFDLEQARYGELRKGDAVLIFVTEDFSRKGLVKTDNPGVDRNDDVRVLKLNFARDFQTGIYTYHTLQSVFTPVDRSRDSQTLKITTSSQEWCGHIFMDLRLTGQGYLADVNSYFEGESARDLLLGKVVVEEEIWNLIRLDPGSLPTGSFRALPGSLDIRLRHEPLDATKAEGSLSEGENGGMVYEIRYPDRGRSLRIFYDGAFPRSINGWEETVEQQGQVLTTRAVRREQKMLDYWSYNGTRDDHLRDELGLP